MSRRPPPRRDYHDDDYYRPRRRDDRDYRDHNDNRRGPPPRGYYEESEISYYPRRSPGRRNDYDRGGRGYVEDAEQRRRREYEEWKAWKERRDGGYGRDDRGGRYSDNESQYRRPPRKTSSELEEEEAELQAGKEEREEKARKRREKAKAKAKKKKTVGSDDEDKSVKSGDEKEKEEEEEENEDKGSKKSGKSDGEKSEKSEGNKSGEEKEKSGDEKEASRAPSREPSRGLRRLSPPKVYQMPQYSQVPEPKRWSRERRKDDSGSMDDGHTQPDRQFDQPRPRPLKSQKKSDTNDEISKGMTFCGLCGEAKIDTILNIAMSLEMFFKAFCALGSLIVLIVLVVAFELPMIAMIILIFFMAWPLLEAVGLFLARREALGEKQKSFISSLCCCTRVFNWVLFTIFGAGLFGFSFYLIVALMGSGDGSSAGLNTEFQVFYLQIGQSYADSSLGTAQYFLLMVMFGCALFCCSPCFLCGVCCIVSAFKGPKAAEEHTKLTVKVQPPPTVVVYSREPTPQVQVQLQPQLQPQNPHLVQMNNSKGMMPASEHDLENQRNLPEEPPHQAEPEEPEEDEGEPEEDEDNKSKKSVKSVKSEKSKKSDQSGKSKKSKKSKKSDGEEEEEEEEEPEEEDDDASKLSDKKGKEKKK